MKKNSVIVILCDLVFALYFIVTGMLRHYNYLQFKHSFSWPMVQVYQSYFSYLMFGILLTVLIYNIKKAALWISILSGLYFLMLSSTVLLYYFTNLMVHSPGWLGYSATDISKLGCIIFGAICCTLVMMQFEKKPIMDK